MPAVYAGRRAYGRRRHPRHAGRAPPAGAPGARFAGPCPVAGL